MKVHSVKCVGVKPRYRDLAFQHSTRFLLYLPKLRISNVRPNRILTWYTFYVVHSSSRVMKFDDCRKKKRCECAPAVSSKPVAMCCTLRFLTYCVKRQERGDLRILSKNDVGQGSMGSGQSNLAGDKKRADCGDRQKNNEEEDDRIKYATLESSVIVVCGRKRRVASAKSESFDEL
jgi:hypothetical protein